MVAEEKVHRRINIKFYLIAAVFTLLLFFLGIEIGNKLAQEKVADIELSQKVISVFFELFNKRMEVISNKNELCSITWEDIWQEKVAVGEILAKLELKLGKNNKDVIEQKKTYNEIQAGVYSLLNQINDKCSYNWSIILFFYTNDNKLGEQFKFSELQGYALDSLYNSDADKIKVLAFDSSAKSPKTQELIEKYNIKEFPYLIINNNGYNGFKSKYEITQILQGK
jgi:hypothetical protein